MTVLCSNLLQRKSQCKIIRIQDRNIKAQANQFSESRNNLYMLKTANANGLFIYKELFHNQASDTGMVSYMIRFHIFISQTIGEMQPERVPDLKTKAIAFHCVSKISVNRNFHSCVGNFGIFVRSITPCILILPFRPDRYHLRAHCSNRQQ